MPISNFPAGFASGVNIRGLPLLSSYPGKVFWVDSQTGSNGNRGTFDRPWATIDSAFDTRASTQGVKANRGDIVAVKAGHTEAPTTSIAHDVAGVWVMGMGWGADMPTITFGAAGAEYAMSAASGRLSGIRFALGTVAATVTNAINVTAGSCIVEHCETVMHATSQFTNHLTATDAQWVALYNNRFRSLHTAGSTSGIVVDGCDDLEIVGNIVSGHFGEHALDNTTPASVDEILRAYIADNVFKNDSVTAGDMAVELDAAATGMFARNMLSGGLATTAANYDIGNMASLESYIVDSLGVDVHGIVLGTAAV